MREFYDIFMLLLFVSIVCTFLTCCKGTNREENAYGKVLDGASTSELESGVEFEDLHSSDMDNDDNDVLESIEKPQELNDRDDVSIICDAQTDRELIVDEITESSDDELSMTQMREQYYKSQTVAKRYSYTFPLIQYTLSVRLQINTILMFPNGIFQIEVSYDNL